MDPPRCAYAIRKSPSIPRSASSTIRLIARRGAIPLDEVFERRSLRRSPPRRRKSEVLSISGPWAVNGPKPAVVGQFEIGGPSIHVGSRVPREKSRPRSERGKPGPCPAPSGGPTLHRRFQIGPLPPARVDASPPGEFAGLWRARLPARRVGFTSQPLRSRSAQNRPGTHTSRVSVHRRRTRGGGRWLESRRTRRNPRAVQRQAG